MKGNGESVVICSNNGSVNRWVKLQHFEVPPLMWHYLGLRQAEAFIPFASSVIRSCFRVGTVTNILANPVAAAYSAGSVAPI